MSCKSSALLILLVAALLAVANPQKTNAQFKNPFKNTPLDPDTWRIPRAESGGSNLSVISGPFITSNGQVYSGTGNSGQKPVYVGKAYKKQVQGRWYWMSSYSDIYGKPQPRLTSAPYKLDEQPREKNRRSWPNALTTYHKDENGRTYMYQQTAGKSSQLTVSRQGRLIHKAERFDGYPVNHNGRAYWTFRVTFTCQGSPPWTYEAMRGGVFLIYVPSNGNGRILYSTDCGNTFVPERNCPPAGWAQR